MSGIAELHYVTFIYIQGRQEDLGGPDQINNVRPLHKLNDIVWSPQCVKHASYLMGSCGNAPRKLLKIRLFEIEFESNLSTTNILMTAQYQEIKSLNLYSKLSAKYIPPMNPPGPSFLRSAFPLASISICCCFTLCLTFGTQAQKENLCWRAEMLCYVITDSSQLYTSNMILPLVQ